MFFINFTKRPPHTREMVTRVRELAQGGETCFERANLRPSDETWWTESTEAMASAMMKEIEVSETSDEALIATIPETAYKGCYDKRDRERIQKDALHQMRLTGRGSLVLGFILRDTERLCIEALFMGDAVIKARSQLRAFAAAMALETGCAKFTNDDSTPEEA